MQAQSGARCRDRPGRDCLDDIGIAEDYLEAMHKGAQVIHHNKQAESACAILQMQSRSYMKDGYWLHVSCPPASGG